MDGDANAGANREFVAADRDRLGESFEQAPGEVHGLRLLGAVEQQGELVSSEAGKGVAGAGALAQPRGNPAQQIVPRVVAEAVVYLLEAVKVEKQDREDVAGARRAGQRLVEPVAEQGPVRQAGEAVV